MCGVASYALRLVSRRGVFGFSGWCVVGVATYARLEWGCVLGHCLTVGVSVLGWCVVGGVVGWGCLVVAPMVVVAGFPGWWACVGGGWLLTGVVGSWCVARCWRGCWIAWGRR